MSDYFTTNKNEIFSSFPYQEFADRFSGLKGLKAIYKKGEVADLSRSERT